MKKLSNKQKLIGGIAIILVAIILAIVITTNVINNNVGSESYSATTANANSNLVASYIKSGITIGGITGTLESLNTFDATALPEDILWGETAYVKGEKVTGTKIVTVAHAKAAQKTFEENTTLIDDYGNRVKVPAGFKIASDSATAVTGGVVIEDVSAEGATEDTKGSQFVWAPVGDVITDNDGSTTNIILGRYTFASDGKENLVQSAENWSNTSNSIMISYNDSGHTYNCKELSNSTYGNETAKELENFITKSLSSGGYYIGRYEAGDATTINSERTSSSKDNNPIVCKTGVYPYNFVTQQQASDLCQNMYKSDNFESDLINSYAWDTLIIYIQKFSGDNNYSQQVGGNTVDKLQKCGESILANVDNGDEEKDIRCNIFDIAGNSHDWTTETNLNSSYPCIARGGYYNTTYSITAARFGNNSGSTVNEYGSPRPILYL